MNDATINVPRRSYFQCRLQPMSRSHTHSLEQPFYNLNPYQLVRLKRFRALCGFAQTDYRNRLSTCQSPLTKCQKWAYDELSSIVGSVDDFEKETVKIVPMMHRILAVLLMPEVNGAHKGRYPPKSVGVHPGNRDAEMVDENGVHLRDRCL